MPHYFILDAPVASPAKCGLCGYAGSDRKYLDPRLDFEFYGTLIFCESCVGTMANDFGFNSPAQVEVLHTRLEEAEREVVLLRSAVVNLENAHDALSNLHSLFDSGVPVSIAPAVKQTIKPTPKLTVGAQSISSVLEGSGNPEDDKSPSVTRSNDVPVIAESDGDDFSI